MKLLFLLLAVLIFEYVQASKGYCPKKPCHGVICGKHKVCVTDIGGCTYSCKPKVCVLKVRGKSHKIFEKRWYYNKSKGKCTPLPHGVFRSKIVCEKKCNVPICKRPKIRGPCKKHIVRWYYNKSKGKCLPFKFGGCKSNGNNFKTKLECLKECKSHH